MRSNNGPTMKILVFGATGRLMRNTPAPMQPPVAPLKRAGISGTTFEHYWPV